MINVGPQAPKQDQNPLRQQQRAGAPPTGADAAGSNPTTHPLIHNVQRYPSGISGDGGSTRSSQPKPPRKHRTSQTSPATCCQHHPANHHRTMMRHTYAPPDCSRMLHRRIRANLAAYRASIRRRPRSTQTSASTPPTSDQEQQQEQPQEPPGEGAGTVTSGGVTSTGGGVTGAGSATGAGAGGQAESD